MQIIQLYLDFLEKVQQLVLEQQQVADYKQVQQQLQLVVVTTHKQYMQSF
jgi:hypothetical protein